jgi:hypothetical protein
MFGTLYGVVNFKFWEEFTFVIPNSCTLVTCIIVSKSAPCVHTGWRIWWRFKIQSWPNLYFAPVLYWIISKIGQIWWKSRRIANSTDSVGSNLDELGQICRPWCTRDQVPLLVGKLAATYIWPPPRSSHIPSACSAHPRLVIRPLPPAKSAIKPLSFPSQEIEIDKNPSTPPASLRRARNALRPDAEPGLRAAHSVRRQSQHPAPSPAELAVARTLE